MDASNTLWRYLIFPHCDGPSLLALRLVCRVFLEHLLKVPAQVWLALTWPVDGLTYEERMAGWTGVARAMAREARMVDNVSSGKHTPFMVTFAKSDWSTGAALICNRVLVFNEHESRKMDLYDLQSGARVWSSVEAVVVYSNVCVLDRWFVFTEEKGTFVLDCASDVVWINLHIESNQVKATEKYFIVETFAIYYVFQVFPCGALRQIRTLHLASSGYFPLWAGGRYCDLANGCVSVYDVQTSARLLTVPLQVFVGQSGRYLVVKSQNAVTVVNVKTLRCQQVLYDADETLMIVKGGRVLAVLYRTLGRRVRVLFENDFISQLDWAEGMYNDLFLDAGMIYTVGVARTLQCLRIGQASLAKSALMYNVRRMHDARHGLLAVSYNDTVCVMNLHANLCKK